MNAPKIAPFVYEGVPTCSHDCPQMTRRLRKDGEPSQTRPWFCALDGHHHNSVCPPAVRRMSTELVKLRKKVRGHTRSQKRIQKRRDHQQKGLK